MCTNKTVKIICIVLAVIAAAVGIYFVAKKIIDKKKAEADSEENYVSCSCCDA